MTNEIKEQLLEKTMKDMLETLSGVEKYVLVEKIVDLQSRIDKAIKYIDSFCLEYGEYVGYGDDLDPKELVEILRGKDNVR